MGRARRAVITKDDTTIVEGGGQESDIKGRINQIKSEIENTDSDWDREKLQERLAKLAGGVALIKVGAATEVELKEKKHRIEGAVVVQRIRSESGATGFNAETGDWADLFKAGIIDPAKVTRSALQNAASIAGLVLTTESAVVEKPEEEDEAAAAAAGAGHMH